jgi:predicted nucleic acid-binding protein
MVVAKLAASIASYAFGSSFTTWTPRLEGDKVFGSTKHKTNYSLRANDMSHIGLAMSIFLVYVWPLAY